MKYAARILRAAIITLALSMPGPALAGEAQQQRREGPRIIFGQHGDTSFEFDSLRPMRRSAASSRQAYFGSGARYDETLRDLHNSFQAIEGRHRLRQLPLSAAQESALTSMDPALMRALTLAKMQRAAKKQRSEGAQ